MLEISDSERQWRAYSLGLPNGGVPNLKQIMAAVSLQTGVSITEIKSERRNKQAVYARQLYCYVARLMTPMSFPRISATILRDHTTAVYAFYHVEELLAKGKPGLSEDIEAVKATIYAFAEGHT